MDKNRDNLLHRIIIEKVNNTIDAPLAKLINESESHDVAEIIKKLDLQSIEDDILKSAKRHHNVESWRVDLTQNDYSAIIEGLNSNSTSTKLSVLDKLLNIDIDTKQIFWEELSQSLRKCFVSATYDIFLRTLKIHHRLSNTSSDGYLNLLRGTFLLLNSRYFTDFNKVRILQSLKVVLDTQKAVMKFLLHANHTTIDEITTAFISVLTYKTVFDWFGALDPQSNWIRVFCYGADIRNIFFNNLKEKKLNFIKNVMATFLQKINSSEEDWGVHYGHFLLYFWRYNNNNTTFVTDTDEGFKAIINKLSQGKRTELTDLFIDLFTHNPSILTPQLLDALVAPLNNTNRNNIRNLVETNKFVFAIINNVTKSGNHRVLFGVSGTLRKARARQVVRNVTNVPQKITDLAVLLLKTNVNTNELNQDLGSLEILLHCCLCLYENHPLALLHGNPAKLLQSMNEFYQTNRKTHNTFLPLFNFFCANFGRTIRIFDWNSEIYTDLFANVPVENLKSVITRLGSDKLGFEFLNKRHRQIVQPYLEEILISDETVNSNSSTKFVLFLFVVKLNARSAVALLADDDGDTVVESEDKSVTLSELIEKSLSESVEPNEEYLGLLTMKVFITNLDLLLYLQTNYQMQKKLEEAARCSDIIDAQSCLRDNILVSLSHVGFVNKSGDTPPVYEILEQGKSGENEFRVFLDEDTTGNFSWLSQARKAFKNSLHLFDPSILEILLEKIPKTYVYRKIELQWPPSDSVYYQLHPEDFSGVSLIIDYGLKTGLLKPPNEYSENLIFLIKQSRAFIGYQPENFTNFDWFVGFIFLTCSGDLHKCKSILINFTNTQVTSLIWATFGKEFDYLLQESFHQHFAVVLEENCSGYQALKVLGICPEILLQSWLNQCFFNFLRFEEICNFLAFSVLYPIECLMYYFVAIFRHLDDRICTITHSPELQEILEMCDMSEFRLSDHMPLIEKLTKCYRNTHKL
ncbi:uncharacterized protein LOC103312777 [Tribolium castaneum]|uniref:BROMI C-terminal Rab TBC-like domain-containing protein n=1 Tax=Tribolium castaneum TaxID=7070 RepID=D2A0W7_TRICA|nr:PREDICTED: uncharacterized protein LOC103312777 [Tribolium castaneum]EFA02572.2 hypothetical protein TcasGA2_TC008283 [Tribolium castaneum]|eukprot:XP_015834679.1 PREDICTED: uncharacterized protein LOC103312777 [Tribolium castaneum]